MSYRDTLTALSEVTEAQVVAAYEQYDDGALPEAASVAIVAAFVAAANLKAASLADLSLALSVTVALKSPVVPFGLTPPAGDAQRLTRAAQTILDSHLDTRMQVARLARSEPLTTAARAYSEGMARSAHVTGWVRGMDADPCQLCTWWWREGPRLARRPPDAHPPWLHLHPRTRHLRGPP